MGSYYVTKWEGKSIFSGRRRGRAGRSSSSWRLGSPGMRAIPSPMKVKARDGKVYEVTNAPPGGSHEVRLDGTVVGSFVLEPKETVVTVKHKSATETLLVYES